MGIYMCAKHGEVASVFPFCPKCLSGNAMVNKGIQAKPTGIDATLVERGSRYGSFPDHAAITQRLKEIMHGGAQWSSLDDDMREALEMVAHKIGRILNGDPFYHDSWHDIIGYTKLVADRLEPAP